MGYQMPNVVKEIYLPLVTEKKTLAKYKEETGIDMREFIELDNTQGGILINFGYSKVYFTAPDDGLLTSGIKVALVDAMYVKSRHMSGNTGGKTVISSSVYDASETNNIFGLSFQIDANVSFEMDNVTIEYFEL